MEEIKLDLSRPQAMKLARGGAIQLRPEMIGSGIPLTLDSKKVRKLMRKKQQGKGVRVSLSQPEVEGSGLFDILKGVGKAVLSVLPVRQIAQNVLSKAIPAAASRLPASIAPIATQLAEAATPGLVEKAGQLAGQGVRGKGVRGKGVRGKGVRAGRGVRAGGQVGQIEAPSDMSMGSGISSKPKSSKGPYKVSSDSSFFMGMDSAAMNPPADAVPASGSFAYLFRDPSKRGGSGILPAGFKR